jgi:hypothetical protein
MGLYYRAYQRTFLTQKKLKMAKLLASSETVGQDFKMTKLPANCAEVP